MDLPLQPPLSPMLGRPGLVCEVAYDQVDGDRFRHPARLVRWRPDRDPGSCTFEQLEVEDAAQPGDIAPPLAG